MESPSTQLLKLDSPTWATKSFSPYSQNLSQVPSCPSFSNLCFTCKIISKPLVHPEVTVSPGSSLPDHLYPVSLGLTYSWTPLCTFIPSAWKALLTDLSGAWGPRPSSAVPVSRTSAFLSPPQNCLSLPVFQGSLTTPLLLHLSYSRHVCLFLKSSLYYLYLSWPWLEQSQAYSWCSKNVYIHYPILWDTKGEMMQADR